jgi:hypothetical protein
MIDKRTAEDKKDKRPSEEGGREMGKRKPDELSYKRRQQIHERNERPGRWVTLRALCYAYFPVMMDCGS